MFLDNFISTRIHTGDVEIHVRYAGSGRPILLLHGYPETHIMWHEFAPRLISQGYAVVLPDLRGYGDSDKPIGLSDHSNYSKRVMAKDMVKVMETLGYEKFDLVGHDRGARVAHRLALDYPEYIRSCTIMDIAPTYDMYHATDMAFARSYYHWFFLIQPFDIPERLITVNAEFYLRSLLQSWSRSKGCFHPQAVAEYIRCFTQPASIHASCEDYRAAATIDMVHDAADRDVKIKSPLLVLWGEKGVVGTLFDVLSIWRKRALHVEGVPIPCGHFLPEEAPEETYRALTAFLEKH